MPRLWQARRKSEGLLAMTLAEVLILLFFVLALALAVTNRDLLKYHDLPPAGLDAIRSGVSAGRLPPDWTSLVVAMEGDSTLRARLQEAAARLGLDPGAVDSTSTKGLVDFLSRGRDYPPCWEVPAEDHRFEIIYALEVVLRADEIDVRRKWPESYQVRAEQVTNLMNLAEAGTISYAHFRREALPVFKWSQRQPTRCRHYVVIHDSVQSANAKEDYKHGLLTVEDFFYKYLVR